jgi:glutamine---fructose-6-phosphate transaminase (isomerizing)
MALRSDRRAPVHSRDAVKPDGFLRDILAAPERLTALLDAYDGASSPLAAVPATARRAVLIGMGSSRFAALPAAALMRSRGFDAVAELATTALPTAPGKNTLAIGISASGSSAETVEALERHRGTSTTVAVTNNPDGPLARIADIVLPLAAGIEEGGVACLTFQATLALLQLLAAALTESGPSVDDLRPAIPAIAALRAGREEWLPTLADHVAAAHTTYTIAPAERLSSALQSALMLREGPRLAADATETGDWLHIDVYLSKRPGYTALLFPGSRYDEGVLGYARERSSTIIVAGQRLDGAALTIPIPGADDPLVALLAETGVAELVAAELWQRGVTAGDPALVS